MMTIWIANTRAACTRSAAPAGGARLWGRGCILALTLSATSALAETPMEVPSGQPVTLSEVLLDDNPGELWVRFRFLAPEISRGSDAVTPEAAADDMQMLCDTFAVPYLTEYAIEPARIVVSFSDRIVPFGLSDPDATQFFELYSLQDGSCMWEEF